MPKLDNKKQAIIDAALSLFASNGYDATPISMIARKAGVSQGLLYNFFASKEALLKEIIRSGLDDIALSMAGYQTITNPREAIRTHIESTVAIIKKRKSFWRLLHGIRLQGSVLNIVEDDYRQTITAVTKVFEQAFRKLNWDQPRLEATLLLAQIDGLVILYLQDEQTPIKKLAQQIINRYTK